MDRFLNAQKGYAAAQAGALGQPRMGIVTSYNPNDGTAKVTIQPENTLTGWLPVLAQSVGPGWGMHTPLKTGEQVLVLPHDGDMESGIIVGRCYSDVHRPPAASNSDMLFQSSGGAIVNLLTNGHVVVSDASGASVTLSNNGTITIAANGLVLNTPTIQATGTLNVTGPINVAGTVAVTGAITINGTVVIAP